MINLIASNSKQNFLLKCCLSAVDQFNSGVICGEAIDIIHRLCNESKSPLSQYRRNFLRVLEPYIEFIHKMIVTLHAVDSN
jgi:hypothetical protein